MCEALLPELMERVGEVDAAATAAVLSRLLLNVRVEEHATLPHSRATRTPTPNLCMLTCKQLLVTMAFVTYTAVSSHSPASSVVTRSDCSSPCGALDTEACVPHVGLASIAPDLDRWASLCLQAESRLGRGPRLGHGWRHRGPTPFLRA